MEKDNHSLVHPRAVSNVLVIYRFTSSSENLLHSILLGSHNTGPFYNWQKRWALIREQPVNLTLFTLHQTMKKKNVSFLLNNQRAWRKCIWNVSLNFQNPFSSSTLSPTTFTLSQSHSQHAVQGEEKREDFQILTCWLWQSKRRTVTSRCTRHAASWAVYMLSWVKGAYGARVLVGQSCTWRTVMSLRAGPQQGHISCTQSWITVVTLKERFFWINNINVGKG